MKPLRHARARLLAVLTALAFLFLIGSAPPATAATGCYNTTCDGKDPHKMGCDLDAKQLTEITAVGSVRVQLFRSTACDSEWVKGSSNGACWDKEVLMRWRVLGSSTVFQTSRVYCPGWTTMVGWSSHAAEGCGQWAGGDIVVSRDCTAGWY